MKAIELLEWAERAAPRIALDGPLDQLELAWICEVFDILSTRQPLTDPSFLRSLGYAHLRERRCSDALACFAAAVELGGDDAVARHHLDQARTDLVSGALDEAIRHARAGLELGGLTFETRDDLRDTIERALLSLGRKEEALAILDQRAVDCDFDLAIHHRLARERLARGDIGGAASVLERAAAMPGILGEDASDHADRVGPAFEPIIRELAAAKSHHAVKVLTALVEKIRTAN